jgi:hypothetical protein
MIVSFANLAFILGSEYVVEHYGFLWSGRPKAELASETNHLGNRAGRHFPPVAYRPKFPVRCLPHNEGDFHHVIL